MLDAAPDCDEISLAIEKALSLPTAPVTSPYGDGHAAERMLHAILEAPDRNTLLHKRTTILAEDVDAARDDGMKR